MARLMIPLENDEKKALIVMAEMEKRDPRQQAALFVRQELERRGLLQPTTPKQGAKNVATIASI